MKTQMMIGLVCLWCGVAQGQKVIHAMAGTVTVANMNSMMLSLQMDDGEANLFHIAAGADSATKLDKALQAAVTPVAQAKAGDYVVVFYTEDNAVRTALAVDDLGPAAPERSAGTVAKFDKKSHQLSLGGTTAGQSVTLSEKTVVDTPDGVVSGMKYHPSKGDRVEVKSSKEGQAALFVAVAT